MTLFGARVGILMNSPVGALIIFILFAGKITPLKGAQLPDDLRVIGGYTTDIEEFPYMVSIQAFSNDWYHNCGGSIISERAVLTACHCLVSSYNPKPVYKHPQLHRVVAGVGHLGHTANAQVIRAYRFVVHPECGGPMLYSDTGVIELQDSISFNNAVKPITFSTLDREQALKKLQQMENGRTPCYSPGWGTTVGLKSGYRPSWQLKVTPATLLPSKECADFFCKHAERSCGMDFFKEHQVCASSSSGIVCNGDSGGPLVCRGYVIGVVSWKWDCIIGWPHVYSDIGPILDVVPEFLRPQLTG